MNQNPTPSEQLDRLRQPAKESWHALQDSDVPVIYVGHATCGRAAGSQETIEGFEQALADKGIAAEIRTVGCLGHCYAEPLVIIHYPGFPPLMYQKIGAGEARVLVNSFLQAGEDPCFEYLLGALEPNEMFPTLMDYPRYLYEKRVIMAHCGRIDPENIDHYLALDGYQALAKALEQGGQWVVDEVKAAHLRGRGGAGFPAGIKWEIARHAEKQPKVVICNGDEGDPGAYMDRTLMESNPHQVLEGLAIAALAVGAERAILYIRAEYPLAVRTIQQAIYAAREKKLLGDHILGTDFSLDISIFQGSGAFVCGEETALIQSVEGHRGMPQYRPPYPAVEGLDGLPTVINNVKTLATVPAIISKGSDWFKTIGTEKTPGTAIFSVVGEVEYPGLVEVPMGVSLEHLIYEVCGGIKDGKPFKAVQIGGPSGGCLPESELGTAIDFDSLKQAGAMMGSGGMVVMNADACMVEVARYFVDFTQKESCGKCTFCRIGTRHLLAILEDFTKGVGSDDDLQELKSLSEGIIKGSLCSLGKTAPNPVLTTLKFFPDEYLAHIHEQRCPAMMCRALTAFYIDLEACARGCDACVACCPTEAIFTTSNRKKAIDQEKCVKCGECVYACPPEYDAVRRVSPPGMIPDQGIKPLVETKEEQ
ncbi:MAG: SLBB domain-containing protein [Deltaproteobacteria bacterium]|nr:SLBB domain-containing protein [Candidatus Anaeroferrophillus wilburensis]MBN2888566.1 SLBB domain-containing protein [Deltaproteobacteria bacterium]